MFPYPEGLVKHRYSTDADNPFGLEKEERHFVWKDAEGGPAKAGQVPYLPPDFGPRPRAILLEGETDTMATWQNLPESLRGKLAVVGLSGADSWKERYAEELFGSTDRVFVVFDREDPYQNKDAADSVERGWQKIRGDLGRKARRVTLPQGINDVAEFFQQYDWAAFEALLKQAAEPRRHYRRVDLDQPIPDVDWLVDDLFVKREVTLLAGDGGSGKSWLAMALATAVARGDKTFLGQPLRHGGKVLYVEQENPLQLALMRFAALSSSEKFPHQGIDPLLKKNLELLWYAGVNLYEEPQLLLEEAVELEPELVVVDSMTSVSIGVKSENDSAEMSRIMRGALIPIARESGAAVVVLHHSDKGGSGARGSSEIRNGADQVLSIKRAETLDGFSGTRVNIFPNKPRRLLIGLSADIVGEAEKDGWTAVRLPEEAF